MPKVGCFGKDWYWLPTCVLLLPANVTSAASGRPNSLNGIRIVLIDAQNQNEIFIMRNKKAVFRGRELPVQTAYIDQIIDQIKRAPSL